MKTITRVERTNLVYVLRCAGLDPILVAQVKELCKGYGHFRRACDIQAALIGHLMREKAELEAQLAAK